MGPSKASFPFFDLPPELRENILSRLLIRPDGVQIINNNSNNNKDDTDKSNHWSRTRDDNGIDDDDDDDDGDDGTQSPLPYFLASMQMYREASGIFYTQNDFVLDIPTRNLPESLTSEGGLLGPPPPPPRLRRCGDGDGDIEYRVRYRICRLTVLLRRVGGDFETALAPALSDMVLRGGLRHLAVHVRGGCGGQWRQQQQQQQTQTQTQQRGRWPSGASTTTTTPTTTAATAAAGTGTGTGTTTAAAGGRCTSPPDTSSAKTRQQLQREEEQQQQRQLMASPPYRALFALLADPDLDAVELWAPPLHYAFWCPFHGDLKSAWEALRRQAAAGGGKEEEDTTANAMVERDGELWVRLDWRAMVDAFGPGQQKIVRVGGRSH